MRRTFHSRITTLAAAFAAAIVHPAIGAAHDRAPQWSGFYLGTHIGYAWAESRATMITDCNVPLGIYCAGGSTSVAANDITRSGSGSMRAGGALGGATIGADLQVAGIIVGAVLDFSVAHVDVRRSGSGQTSQLPFNYTVSSTIEMDWLSTLRARLGYAITPDHLLYVTVGAAIAELEVSQNYFDDIGTVANRGSRLYANHSSIKTGVAFGAGGEWLIARNWSLTAEYLRIDFGSVVSYGKAIFQPSPNITQPHTMSADLSLNIVRVGLNYRF